MATALRPRDKSSRVKKFLFFGAVCSVLSLLSLSLWAAPGIPAITVTPGQGGGQQSYTVTLQIIFLMTLLTLLPSALVMLTSFTRIIIVLAILRQALGLGQTPSNQVMIGLALFMTIFIMSPIFQEIYDKAVAPYMTEKIIFQDAVQTAAKPLRAFMTGQTRENDLKLFLEMSGHKEVYSPEEIPFPVLVAAFITSELKTAFQIGFLIFIPFLIIDLMIASILMAMGMMMLSPMMISMPFKIMLFVLVDGWTLILGTLAQSFYR